MRNIFLGLVICCLAAVVLGWSYIRAVFISGVPTTLATEYVHIPTGSSFETVTAVLDNGGFIDNVDDFTWLAERMKYKKELMRAGRFKVQAGWTNRDLIRHLRGGEQSPVKVVLTNAWRTDEVAGKVAKFIEADSLSLIQAFQDPTLMAEFGRTSDNLMAFFIPNTYELYWNTDAEGFLKRMQKEYKSFWESKDRTAKAKALGLTPDQVYTVASIVERESNYNPERPRIAGVYLNRLTKGMKLQADPTCKFASNDLAAKRVTFAHLAFDSPFNTYMYEGLPPGPISMASIPSIDAVLNREAHDYLFFCARPDDSGQHAFAESMAGHGINVAKFRVYQANVLGQR